MHRDGAWRAPINTAARADAGGDGRHSPALPRTARLRRRRRRPNGAAGIGGRSVERLRRLVVCPGMRRGAVAVVFGLRNGRVQRSGRIGGPAIGLRIVQRDRWAGRRGGGVGVPCGSGGPRREAGVLSSRSRGEPGSAGWQSRALQAIVVQGGARQADAAARRLVSGRGQNLAVRQRTAPPRPCRCASRSSGPGRSARPKQPHCCPRAPDASVWPSGEKASIQTNPECFFTTKGFVCPDESTAKARSSRRRSPTARSLPSGEKATHWPLVLPKRRGVVGLRVNDAHRPRGRAHGSGEAAHRQIAAVGREGARSSA